MRDKLSVKQILVDLTSITPQIAEGFKGIDKYKTLINFLCSKDFYNDDEVPFPTLKDIEEQTGLKTYQIRKQLEEIYSQLMNYESQFTFDFSEIDIYMYAEYHKKYATIKMRNLKHLPKIGDNIKLPFLKAQTGIDYYYVEDIRHEFSADRQIIEIFLKGGTYNAYWYYRKHKAIELEEISIMERYDLYEFQLKERLGLPG